MTNSLEFETPENIRVAYEPAGLGTRFIAWTLDNILVTCLLVVMIFSAMLLGILTEQVMGDAVRSLQGLQDPTRADRNAQSVRFVQYLLGIAVLMWGFGSFFYFGCSELWLRGQTLGKRAFGLRVVRIDGFALDTSSIFVRNVFRLIDQIPAVWIVPFLSKRSQRFGDIVAGTTVVVDRTEHLSEIRRVLAELPVAESRFTFDAMTLKRARPQDFDAIERILNRWSTIAGPQQQALLDQIVPPLVERLKTNPPNVEERLTYLEDLLAAEYRRQHRHL